MWKRMEGGGSEAARVNGIGLVCRSTHNEGGLQVAFIHEPLSVCRLVAAWHLSQSNGDCSFCLLPPRPPHLAQPGVYVKNLQDVLAAHASDLARIAAGCRSLWHLRGRDGRVAAALRCRLGKPRVASCVGSLLALDCTGQREIRGQAVRLRQGRECGFLRTASGREALLSVLLAWHRHCVLLSAFFQRT